MSCTAPGRKIGRFVQTPVASTVGAQQLKLLLENKMNALARSSAIIALAGGAIAFINAVASAQTVIRVDIVNGSANPSGVGGGWGADAYKFLQDALDRADFLGPNPENPVHIWVAAGTYRPDQSAANPSWLGDQGKSFELRNNVTILGGFAGDEEPLDLPDPVANITILSGDLEDDDEFSAYDSDGELDLKFPEYSDNSDFVVVAVGVNNSAVLDGFTIEGGLDIRSAQPRFRDCVFQLHETMAVRCADGSDVAMYRCRFPAMPAMSSMSSMSSMLCHWITVTQGSRLLLLESDLAHWQHGGYVDVSHCSSVWIADSRDDDVVRLERSR